MSRQLDRKSRLSGRTTEVDKTVVDLLFELLRILCVTRSIRY
jgi:hypothetical protein